MNMRARPVTDARKDASGAAAEMCMWCVATLQLQRAALIVAFVLTEVVN